jgi:hypothetical protein
MPKPRNRCGDFDAQITKPRLPVLRPKPGNPPPPWLCGSSKKLITGFEAKPGETITAGFQAKPWEIVVAGFEAKPSEIVATDFEAKPEKTILVVLRSNHWQTVTIGFEAQTDEKPSQCFCGQTTDKLMTWFWGSTKKPVLLVSTCTMYTAHGATRPLDRPATEYPTCANIPGPLHQISYSSHDPRRCMPCCTCHLHTMRQANAILQMKQRIRVKQPNRPVFEFKPHQVNDSSQSNQGTDHLVSQSSPWWVHWQQRHKVWSSNPRPHEAQLEDQKAKKSSRMSSKRRKTTKANKRHKKWQSQAK